LVERQVAQATPTQPPEVGVADLVREADRQLADPTRQCQIALVEGEDADPAQCGDHPWMARRPRSVAAGCSRVQQLDRALARLGDVAARQPDLAGRAEQAQAGVGPGRLDGRPVERETMVVDLDFESVDPRELAGTEELGLDAL